MALVDVGVFPFKPLDFSTTALVNSTLLIDAAGEKAADVLQISKTGTINGVRVRLGTVTTGQTLRVGLYTVDGSGFPTTTPYSDGAHGTAAVADTDDNIVLSVTFGTPYTATVGDEVALVVEFDSAVGNLTLATASLASKRFPYNAHYTTSWTKNNAPLMMALDYATIGLVVPVGHLPAATTIASVSWNVNTGTGDEIGTLFTAPFGCRVVGVGAVLGNSAAGDFDVCAYDGTTLIPGASKSWDADIAQSASGSAYFSFLFPTPFEMSAGASRRLVVKPTTTTNISTGRLAFPSAAYRTGIFAHFRRTHRVNAGAWTDTDTEILQVFPLLDAIDVSAGGGRGGFNQMVSGMLGR